MHGMETPKVKPYFNPHSVPSWQFIQGQFYLHIYTPF